MPLPHTEQAEASKYQDIAQEGVGAEKFGLSAGEELLPNFCKGTRFPIGADHLPELPTVYREIGTARGCGTELGCDHLAGRTRRRRIGAPAVHESAFRRQPSADPSARVNSKDGCRRVDQALVDEVSNSDPQGLDLRWYFHFT